MKGAVRKHRHYVIASEQGERGNLFKYPRLLRLRLAMTGSEMPFPNSVATIRGKLLIFLVVFSFFLLFGMVRAANIDVSIPNAPSVENNPGAWVGGVYQFSLLAAGMLAFGIIVYAGLRHTYAAGNPSTQTDARDQILQALLGLLLLLGAYIVLTTINPNLIDLDLPGLDEIPRKPSSKIPLILPLEEPALGAVLEALTPVCATKRNFNAPAPAQEPGQAVLLRKLAMHMYT